MMSTLVAAENKWRYATHLVVVFVTMSSQLLTYMCVVVAQYIFNTPPLVLSFFHSPPIIPLFLCSSCLCSLCFRSFSFHFFFLLLKYMSSYYEGIRSLISDLTDMMSFVYKDIMVHIGCIRGTTSTYMGQELYT